MTFAQRRNRLTTHFSERIPVFKRRMTVYGLRRFSVHSYRINSTHARTHASTHVYVTLKLMVCTLCVCVADSGSNRVTCVKVTHKFCGPETSCASRRVCTVRTVMRRLMTGIHYQKCVVRRFRRCTNVIEYTYTNFDSIA